jgi:hypothetical protein
MRMAVLYCHLCGLSGSTKLFNIISLTARFSGKKKGAEHKLWFDFLYNFVWNISYSKKNSARFYHKSTYVFTSSTGYCCQILVKNVEVSLNRLGAQVVQGQGKHERLAQPTVGQNPDQRKNVRENILSSLRYGVIKTSVKWKLSAFATSPRDLDLSWFIYRYYETSR